MQSIRVVEGKMVRGAHPTLAAPPISARVAEGECCGGGTWPDGDCFRNCECTVSGRDLKFSRCVIQRPSSLDCLMPFVLRQQLTFKTVSDPVIAFMQLVLNCYWIHGM